MHGDWLTWCKERLARYPNVLPRQREFNGKINPYHFVEELFEHLDGDDIVACGNATACIVPFQAGKLNKRGMRMFSNSGSASMGYDLPAAIGAWFGAVAERGQQRRVICLAGDGSIMMNLQELQTIAHHRLPIKIFVLNNRGYLSIRTSQTNFFGRLAGEGPDSGVSFPDFVAVATAFGIPARRLASADFARQLAEVLAIRRSLPVRRHPGRHAGVRATHEFAQTRRRQHRHAATGRHVSFSRPGRTCGDMVGSEVNSGWEPEDLFVLELANNHWGRLERGLRIITDFSRIVRFNNVRAAIKIQLR